MASPVKLDSSADIYTGVLALFIGDNILAFEKDKKALLEYIFKPDADGITRY